jgi:hypothetical protein
MKFNKFSITICIILLSASVLSVPLYILANESSPNISFTISGNLTNVFGPSEEPHVITFSFNLSLTIDGETQAFIATGNGTYTTDELDSNNIRNNLALTGNIRDSTGAEVSDCTVTIVYIEDVFSSPAPMSLFLTIDAPNCVVIPDFHWQSRISGTQTWEGDHLSIRNIVSEYATLTGLGVDVEFQLLNSTATCNGTFTQNLVFEMPTLGLLKTKDNMPSSTPTPTPTLNPSPTPEPPIPENLPTGVMVLLSSIAVIVSMLFFRKRPKLK